jgi:hypothetical protein
VVANCLSRLEILCLNLVSRPARRLMGSDIVCTANLLRRGEGEHASLSVFCVLGLLEASLDNADETEWIWPLRPVSMGSSLLIPTMGRGAWYLQTSAASISASRAPAVQPAGSQTEPSLAEVGISRSGTDPSADPSAAFEGSIPQSQVYVSQCTYS